VDTKPDNVSRYQNPKSIIADYRNFDKDSYDGNSSNHEGGYASEVHLQLQDTVRKQPITHPPRGLPTADLRSNFPHAEPAPESRLVNVVAFHLRAP
jgi:hypothetical protein